MKELSIEEKAKAYDEAIEELRGLLEGVHEEKCEIMEEDIIKIFPELKESGDERMRKSILIYLDWLDGRKDYAPKGEYSIMDMIAWLEKQGEKGTNGNEREIPNSEQKPTKWSEEGEYLLGKTIQCLEEFIRIAKYCGIDVQSYQRDIDWLKSIRPRSQWKPSEEQMNTLEYYMHTLVCNEHKEILFGLYADLKKLRGE